MYFVFDLETVPDISLINDLIHQEPITPEELEENSIELTKSQLSDDQKIQLIGTRIGRGNSGFLPPMFHKVVSWVGLWVDINGNPKQKASWSGEKEKEGLEFLFDELLTYKDFDLIHHNGRGFDLPVLEYRALKYSIQMPARMSHKDIKYRYSNNNIDLVDEFSNYGASAWPKLKHLGLLLQIPFKQVSEGNEVYEQYKRGEFEKIENYCYEDVVATYLVWLHLQFTRGHLKETEFDNLKKRALNKLGEIQNL
jgi:predicted PolB exonuclease-like 3'-5' exonuclease